MKGAEDIGYKFRLLDKNYRVVGLAWFTKNNWWYQKDEHEIWNLVRIPCWEMQLFSGWVDKDEKEIYEGDEVEMQEGVFQVIFEDGNFMLRSPRTGIEKLLSNYNTTRLTLLDAIH